MMTVDEILAMSKEKGVTDKEKQREDYCKRFGFNADGYTWLATEQIIAEKDRLAFRSKSGWFDRFLGWHSPRPIAGFRTVKVHMDEISEWDNGRFVTRRYFVDEIRRKAARTRLTKSEEKSQFVGTAGKNISTIVKIDRIVETPFLNVQEDVGGMHNRWDFFFKDKDGNIFKYSSAWYDPEKVREFCGKNTRLRLDAHVYKHCDGYGVKETWITFPHIVKSDGSCLKDFARMKKNDSSIMNENVSEGLQAMNDPV